jgi:hypothetical protein
MRDALSEDQNKMSQKQKNRARVAPKMGAVDIDYQTLYDSFFKPQNKAAQFDRVWRFVLGRKRAGNLLKAQTRWRAKPGALRGLGHDPRILATSVAHQHAAVRASSQLSQPQNYWTECSFT